MTPIVWTLVKATLILLVGLCASEAARRSRASVRHLILASTFAALLILPMVSMIAPPKVIEVPVLESADASTTAPPSEAAVVSEARDRAVDPNSIAATAAPSRLARPVWRGWMSTTVWGAGVFVVVAALSIALFRLRGISRHGIPWIQGEALANDLAREKEIGRSVAVALHEEVSAPMTYGVVRPLIVLPKDATLWSEGDLRRALVHELEHVRRGDWVVQLMARGACALYWFHPLAWVAWRKLCLEGERACDDAVLQSAENTDYAQQLVTLAKRLSSGEGAPVLSMANRSDLSVRVHAVLDGNQLRGRAGRATVAASVAMAAIGVVLVAPLSVVAVERASNSSLDSREEPKAVTVSSQEKGAEERRIVSKLRRSRVSRELGEALVNAAEEGDIDLVKEILASGFDVNTVVEGDGTALIGAARGGQLDMIRLLIEAGAKPDIIANGDGSPLISAARGGYAEIVTTLLGQGANIDLGVPGDGNPLIMAAGEGQVEIVKLLLDRGANIEEVVPGDENPLIHACEGGHLEVVKVLLARGANINARVWVEHDGDDEKGGWRTPLVMARRNGHRKVVEYLVSQGATSER
jgi:ankyrin repeat protein/beta-lactamase regulating signal transducer with metallopeptidase domain